MTDPWKDGARTEPTRPSRVRLVLVLIVSLLLPVAIVGLGSRQPVDVVEVASADATDASLAATVAESVDASLAPSTTEEDLSDKPHKPTTGDWEDTTTAPPTTEAPTTTAAPVTTAKPVAPTTTAAPVVRQVPTTPAPTNPPTTPAPVVTTPPTVGAGPTPAEAAFLACVRRRESGGNYQIVSSNGMYYGAYQFLRSTWNSAANIAGRPDLVGLAPNTVAPADQDWVALSYYRKVGSSPWGGPCY